MLLKDIITQLRAGLPLYGSKYSDQTAIDSISFSGGLVTVSTALAHGLVTNEILNIVGSKKKTVITSIITVDKVATVITSTPHDLTLDFNETDDQPPVTIVESTVTDYNGSFTLLSIPDRNTFTMTVSSNFAPATDGFLLENSFAGFSGVKTITVTSTTAFTYPETGLTPTGTNGTINSRIRISGGIDLDRIIQSYSKQSSGDWWLYVIPQGTTASKDRHVLNDATAVNVTGMEYRQKLLPVFNIFVFAPNSTEKSGRKIYDEIKQESVGLLKSLLNFALPSPYSVSQWATVVYESEEVAFYNTSYMVMGYTFSTMFDVIGDDAFVGNTDVAFRDIEFDLTPSLGDEPTNTEMELDN